MFLFTQSLENKIGGRTFTRLRHINMYNVHLVRNLMVIFQNIWNFSRQKSKILNICQNVKSLKFFL